MNLPVKLGLAGVLLLLFAVHACAQEQDVPRGELLIGASYSRQNSANLEGWHTALNANWNWWAGLDIDLSGHYFSENSFSLATTNNQVYSLRGGPQFTFIRNRCCTAFVHGLIGGTWILSNTHSGFETSSSRESGFSAAVGPGVDININDNLAWRVVQVDYSFFRILGEPSNGVRISTGLVLKFD